MIWGQVISISDFLEISFEISFNYGKRSFTGWSKFAQSRFLVNHSKFKLLMGEGGVPGQNFFLNMVIWFILVPEWALSSFPFLGPKSPFYWL